MYDVPSYLFKCPTNILLSGCTGSGKTSWLKRLLNNPSMFSKPPDRIVYCYGIWTEDFNDMKSVEFREGLDLPSFDKTQHTILILDDLMHEVLSSEEACKLVTMKSHHQNITPIVLVQNLYLQAKHSVTIMQNMHYRILLKSIKDIQKIKMLGREMGKEKAMEAAYKDATSEPYGYLFVDLSPHSIDDLRLRTKVFPGEAQIIYLPK